MNDFSLSFEPQISSPVHRCCAAAALSMVFRAFELPRNQQEIWEEIRSPDPHHPGQFHVETFRIARYAKDQGLSALLARISQPWSFLQTLHREVFHEGKRRFAFIFNHRIREESPLGHFSVFTGLCSRENTVRIHDPQQGPDRKIPREEFLSLWTPRGNSCEITGFVGILLGKSGFLQSEMSCRKCSRCFEFPEHPVQWNSPDSAPWSALFCPHCGLRLRRT